MCSCHLSLLALDSVFEISMSFSSPTRSPIRHVPASCVSDKELHGKVMPWRMFSCWAGTAGDQNSRPALSACTNIMNATAKSVSIARSFQLLRETE